MEIRSPELDIQLRQLAYLVEVAAAPSWTEAADRLGISQPALSQSMHELERRIGAPLFEALGRKRVLTEEGRRVVAYARGMLSVTDDLQTELRAAGDALSGTLRVGMIDAVSLYVLPDAIKQFRAQFPAVDLKLTVAPSAPLTQSLLRLELDMIFVTGPVEDSSLDSILLRQEPLFLYGPGFGDPETGDWVMYPGTARTRGVIDRFFAEAGWEPSVILESANPAVLRQMVGLGFGWSILPEAVAERGRDPLVKKRRRSVASRSIYAAWRRSAARNPRLVSFRNTVVPPD